MSRDVRLYLEDIERACDKIQRFTAGFDFDSFLADGVRCPPGSSLASATSSRHRPGRELSPLLEPLSVVECRR